MRRRVIAGLAAGAAAGAIAGAAAAAVGYRHAVRRASARWRGAAGMPLQTLPDDLIEHFVPVGDGGVLHVVERGSGPPLVLVHGITLGAATWIPELERLADRHRVIAIDQRGHGRSTAGSDGYPLERLADDLLEVLRALDLRRAVLVGHSMGGMVAQLLAVREPLELRRHVDALVLVATSPGPLAPSSAGRILATLLARRFDRSETLFPSEELGTVLTRVSFGAEPRPEDVDLACSMISRMSPVTLSALIGPLLAFDLHHRLASIELPTWVVVGTRDALTPPRMARALVRSIKGAELVVLAGCGHMVMLERPDELCDLLHRVSSLVPSPGPSQVPSLRGAKDPGVQSDR